MEVDIIISIAIAAVILFTIAQVSRTLRSASMHKTLRKAIEQGHQINPELIERLDRAPKAGQADQRMGLILVAIALAIFIAAFMNPGQNNWQQLISVGIFPLLVGAALLARPWLSRRFGGE